MSHKTYFISFFSIGFIFAISLQTGYDISREGIAILVLQAFQSTFPVEDQFFSSGIKILIFLIVIIGIILPLVLGYSAYEEGLTYLIISIIGLLAGISSLFNPILFFILLIVGGIMANALDD